jgi:hypothetical protein
VCVAADHCRLRAIWSRILTHDIREPRAEGANGNSRPVPHRQESSRLFLLGVPDMLLPVFGVHEEESGLDIILLISIRGPCWLLISCTSLLCVGFGSHRAQESNGVDIRLRYICQACYGSSTAPGCLLLFPQREARCRYHGSAMYPGGARAARVGQHLDI